MKSLRYQKIREIFLAACDLGARERESYLQSACDGDTELHSEVSSLLEEFDTRTELLGDVGSDLDARRRIIESVLAEIELPVMPETIGRYRIVSRFPGGGMGAVYEARQENPDRTVALKVVRPGIATDALLRRFEFEAQILGQLRHPGIAQIYEAGTASTEEGPRPYFAMEYVDGERITAYAARQGLSARERLELMAQVCDAVHHAHQRGVIHRDLKPSNILVDETGSPRILDFGVARATDLDIQATTIHTNIGQLVGTVPYMSPEQASGDPSAIDTRSDVYALGIVCYELLAGRMPYDVHDKLVHEATRIIQEDEPSRLGALDRTLRGDVETIVARALEKEKDRRYASASEFAADIRRYLNGDPISARRTSFGYQMRALVIRNKLAVSVAATLFLGLLVGSTGLLFGYLTAVDARHAEAAERHRADRESFRANQSAEQQAQIAQFTQNVLFSSIPERAQGKDVSALRDMIDGARKMLDAQAEAHPFVCGALNHMLGTAYSRLGDWEAAEDRLKIAIESLETIPHINESERLAVLVDLGLLYKRMAKYDLAREYYGRAITFCEDRSPKFDEDLPIILNNYGMLLLNVGQAREAHDVVSSALQQQVRQLGSEHKSTTITKSNLALICSSLGRLEEALALQTLALAQHSQTLGPTHPTTLISQLKLGSFELKAGNLDEADAILSSCLETSRQVFGDMHPQTLKALEESAFADLTQRRWAEAYVKLEECVESSINVRGPSHPFTLRATGKLAEATRHLGDNDRALTLLRQALISGEKNTQADPVYVRLLRGQYAQSLAEAGLFEDAVHQQRRAINDAKRALGDHHRDLMPQLNNLARTYTKLGRTEEALATYKEALDIAELQDVPNKNGFAIILKNYGDCLVKAGDTAAATEYLRDSLNMHLLLFGEIHNRTRSTAHSLVMALEAQGSDGEAREMRNRYNIEAEQ